MTHNGRFSTDGRAGDGRNVRATDMTVGDYATGMPNIRIGEMFKSFLRQLAWMIPLLIIGMAVAWFASKDFKRTYQGEGRILVQLGSEYVYESVTSSNQTSGLTLTPDHIVLNEIGLMKNTDIISRVAGELADEFGESRFAKAQYDKIKKAGRDPIAKKNATVDLYQFMDKAFVVMPKPKSSIVDMAFKHEDPEIAVRGINLFIKAYMDARKDIFVEGSSDVITERRIATETQLEANDAEIHQFLKRNNISDFDSEQGGARTRTEQLRAALNLLRANMSETESALATVEGQLRNTPAQIDLFVDDRASQRVAQAELELKQLLAKYLPNSNPVRQKQEELRRLQEVTSANGGRATGGRRVGPNTVYQALMTRRNTLQASADSFREREFTLQKQLNSADAKVRKLNSLLPRYNGLMREQSTLDTRLRGYTSKEQEALINQQQAQADSENVRVISISDLPRKGRNMRMIMFAVFVVAWGFTVLMLGLLKVFLDPRLYAPSEGTMNSILGRRRQNDRAPEPVRAYEDPDPLMASQTVPAAKAGIPAHAAQSAIPEPIEDPGLQTYIPAHQPSYQSGAQTGGGGYNPAPYEQTAQHPNSVAQSAYAQGGYQEPTYYPQSDGNLAYDHNMQHGQAYVPQAPAQQAQAQQVQAPGVQPLAPPLHYTPTNAYGMPSGQSQAPNNALGHPGQIPSSEDG